MSFSCKTDTCSAVYICPLCVSPFWSSLHWLSFAVNWAASEWRIEKWETLRWHTNTSVKISSESASRCLFGAVSIFLFALALTSVRNSSLETEANPFSLRSSQTYVSGCLGASKMTKQVIIAKLCKSLWVGKIFDCLQLDVFKCICKYILIHIRCISSFIQSTGGPVSGIHQAWQTWLPKQEQALLTCALILLKIT